MALAPEAMSWFQGSSGNAHTKAYKFCEKVHSWAADSGLHKEHQALHRAHPALFRAAAAPSASAAVPGWPGQPQRANPPPSSCFVVSWLAIQQEESDEAVFL